MASKALPSPEVLRQLLRYEPETGKLFWLPRTPEMFVATARISAAHRCALFNASLAEKEAMTCVTDNGYLKGKILGITVSAHRVIWAMQTGEWPEHEVDHKNHIGKDNRWENIRDATPAQNASNRRAEPDGTSQFKGVYLHQRPGRKPRWWARLMVRGKRTSVGFFDSEIAAAKAYDAAARAQNGPYAITNFPA